MSVSLYFGIVRRARHLDQAWSAKARRGNDGRLLVELPPSQWLVADQAPTSERLAVVEAQLVEARRQLGDAQARLVDTQAEVIAAKAEVTDARIAGAQAEERAASLRELVDVLKSELAEARRPFWRRWLARISHEG